MLKTTIFTVAIAWSLTAGAGAYKCALPDGRTVYQQAPCGESAKPMELNTQDTGTGGLRPSEREFLDDQAQSNPKKQEQPATTGAANPHSQECATLRERIIWLEERSQIGIRTITNGMDSVAYEKQRYKRLCGSW
ncbi:MAG: hypothetical protein P9E24_15780 [Candidatus Competibacter sp.]|nr:hypothetical protein [Candidatus Competibacter sp.]MDG4585058.1 hypothetical protein [Candidatus Competibacter sp.]